MIKVLRCMRRLEALVALGCAGLLVADFGFELKLPY